MLTLSFILASLATSTIAAALPQPVVMPHGGRLTLNVVKAKTLDKRQGSVTPTPYDASDSWYTVPIGVGSQNFNVDIDTGSGTFWLLSSLTTPSQGTNSPVYTPGSSATSINKSFTTTYADGSGAQGDGYKDRISFGGASLDSVVGAATTVNGWSPTRSGMLGLGYGSIQYAYPSPGPSTLMESLRPSLASPVFTLDLYQKKAGTMDLGFVDKNKYAGSLSYVPREQSSVNKWRFVPGPYAINNVVSSSNLSTLALPDSGATMLIVPQSVATNYYHSVPSSVPTSSGLYYFPCTNIAQNLMPSFGINLGGTFMTIPGQYMWWRRRDSKNCWGAMQATNGSSATLGDMFHRTQFVAYDYSNGGRLGFAPKASLPPAPMP